MNKDAVGNLITRRIVDGYIIHFVINNIQAEKPAPENQYNKIATKLLKKSSLIIYN
ncbi:MAG: hypothetical protein GY941_09645 [Planctomycetes bacterium]|nr:hypothetical protein [Planctomycetota bacterium]